MRAGVVFLRIKDRCAQALAQVDNSAELPLLLLGIVKDPEELADGHFPGDAPDAILDNPALSCAAAVSTSREAKGDVKITEPFQ